MAQLHGKEIESLGIVFSLKTMKSERERERERERRDEHNRRENEIIVLWIGGEISYGYRWLIIFASFQPLKMKFPTEVGT
mgnify:CR=1 FL=1